MSSVRAFLAVPLPQALQDAVGALQRELLGRLPGVRWVRPANLHLTVQFFAALEQEDLEKVKVSMLSVKAGQRPFSVALTGLGAFPSRHRPRVVWLGLEPAEPLVQLHGLTGRLLHRAGVATESRPYSPHLTIGRLRQPTAGLPQLDAAAAACGSLPVDRLVLYESRLDPGGAEHIPRMTVTFDDEPGTR